MSSKKNVSYFPVEDVEQALLLRVRDQDVRPLLPTLVSLVDLLAEARLSPADLEQAIRMLEESRQSEGLDARFDNLEARLSVRIEKALTEIEGRLSKRLGGDATGATASRPVVPQVPKVSTPAGSASPVPSNVSLAVRIGTDMVSGVSAAQFYVAVWRWLFQNRHLSMADLPIAGTHGRKRYLVAATPIHPTGKDFFRAIEAVPGAFVEANLSRGDIIRLTKKQLGLRNVPFQMVVGTG